jgi:hypothetical protein
MAFKQRPGPLEPVCPADATSALIPGVGYVTAGIAAIADLQAQGYQYVQP